MNYISTPNAPAAIGPYSQAVLANGTLYMSGQIALIPGTSDLNDADIETETRQVMENMRAVLKEAGMDFGNLVKCSIFLKSMDDYAKVNEVYGSFFEDGKAPAREAVQVSKLPKDVNVEISGIAVA